MDLKVSDFAHDSKLGMFTVTVGGKRLTSKNPFSLFSSALQFYAPGERPKMAQHLRPVVEQWNMCLSPSLLDAANHAVNKQLSDEFYETVSLICPDESGVYQTRYDRDQVREYSAKEVVTMLTKIECKHKILLALFKLQEEVNPDTGAINEKAHKKILKMSKEDREKLRIAYEKTVVPNPCGTSKSCLSTLDNVLTTQTHSVIEALNQAKHEDKMKKITMIVTITAIVLVLIAIGVVIAVFHAKRKGNGVKPVTVENAGVGDENGGEEVTIPVSPNEITEIEFPDDAELQLSPLKL